MDRGQRSKEKEFGLYPGPVSQQAMELKHESLFLGILGVWPSLMLVSPAYRIGGLGPTIGESQGQERTAASLGPVN